MSDSTATASWQTGPPARVELRLSLDPPLQRRWTVAIRWILALPLAVAGIGIYIAAFFWVVGAWFSALSTGRVPDSLQTKICSVLRFQARLAAYANLMTDQWPGVHFAERADDPVFLDIDHVDLRRSAVFFRLFLAIPAGILSSAVSTGVYPFLVVMWVVALITGRTPRTLHQLAALCVRVTIRSAAFWTLATPTQPFVGFFGDAPEQGGAPSGEGALSRATPAPVGSPWVVAQSVKVLLVVVTVIGLASSSSNRHWNHGKWDAPVSLVTSHDAGSRV